MEELKRKICFPCAIWVLGVFIVAGFWFEKLGIEHPYWFSIFMPIYFVGVLVIAIAGSFTINKLKESYRGITVHITSLIP